LRTDITQKIPANPECDIGGYAGKFKGLQSSSVGDKVFGVWVDKGTPYLVDHFTKLWFKINPKSGVSRWDVIGEGRLNLHGPAYLVGFTDRGSPLCYYPISMKKYWILNTAHFDCLEMPYMNNVSPLYFNQISRSSEAAENFVLAKIATLEDIPPISPCFRALTTCYPDDLVKLALEQNSDDTSTASGKISQFIGVKQALVSRGFSSDCAMSKISVHRPPINSKEILSVLEKFRSPIPYAPTPPPLGPAETQIPFLPSSPGESSILSEISLQQDDDCGSFSDFFFLDL
jgi:hypothetical protein